MATLLSNRPADPSALFAEEIEDLMLEARNYLDGEPIANEEQANAVSAILNRARRIAKGMPVRFKAQQPVDVAAQLAEIERRNEATIDKLSERVRELSTRREKTTYRKVERDNDGRVAGVLETEVME